MPGIVTILFTLMMCDLVAGLGGQVVRNVQSTSVVSNGRNQTHPGQRYMTEE